MTHGTARGTLKVQGSLRACDAPPITAARRMISGLLDRRAQRGAFVSNVTQHTNRTLIPCTSFALLSANRDSGTLAVFSPMLRNGPAIPRPFPLSAFREREISGVAGAVLSDATTRRADAYICMPITRARRARRADVEPWRAASSFLPWPCVRRSRSGARVCRLSRSLCHLRSVADMPATATWLGGAMGLGIAFYSNAVRKLPLLRSAQRSDPSLLKSTSVDAGSFAFASILAKAEKRDRLATHCKCRVRHRAVQARGSTPSGLGWGLPRGAGLRNGR